MGNLELYSVLSITLQDDTVVRVVKGPAKDDVQTIEIWDRVMGLVSSFNLKASFKKFLVHMLTPMAAFRMLMSTAESTLTQSLARCSCLRITKVFTTSQRKRKKRTYPSYPRLPSIQRHK